MSNLGRRIERLIDGVTQSYSFQEGQGVQLLIKDLLHFDVQGVDRYAAKLKRSLKAPGEFRATLREGVYARYLARCGAKVEIEPCGGKGPDLGVAVEGLTAYLELKRLLRGDGPNPHESPEDWYRDEYEPGFTPAGPDPGGDKVEAKVKEAASQLVDGSCNVVVLASFTSRAATGAFERSMAGLEQEIEEQGTYAKLSGVLFVTNSYDGSRRPSHRLWQNGQAEMPIPQSLEALLDCLGNAMLEARKEALGDTADLDAFDT